MRTFEGELQAKGLKFAIIVSRFNDFIGSKLLDGAIDALTRHGASEQNIDIIKVPGAYEIPLAAKKVASKKKHDAVICLGAVIRGGTDHYEYVCSEVAKGIAQVMLETGVPCVFGILTCDTVEQAVDRAGTKGGNKGADAATAALEMANLMSALPGS